MNPYLKGNEGHSNFNLELEKILSEKTLNEDSYTLLLSIYFFLKQNKHDETAEILFNEAKLDKVFLFPQDNTDKDNLKTNFINYFYFNTFMNQTEKMNCFLSDFWNQFWENFVNKIKQSSSPVSSMDKFLKNKSMTLTYNSETLHK